MGEAAAMLNIELEWAAGRSPKEFEAAVDAVAGKRVDAVVFNEEPMQLVNATALAQAALKNRLATIGPLEFAERGAVLAYGVDVPELYRRAAYFVDKILKGAKPGDLPVEQATRFELVVNLRTASQLGLSIPAPLVQRADRVIE
jgi:putative tryptophan/tyrosine transport system substrate-binding protein